MKEDHNLTIRSLIIFRCSQEFLAQELVSSNLILTYFEATKSTSPDAYRLHIPAAAIFLQRIGPGSRKAGILNQLYFAVRAQVVTWESGVFSHLLTDKPFVSVVMQKDMLLIHPEWFNSQYNNHLQKLMSELVMDIMMLLINITM